MLTVVLKGTDSCNLRCRYCSVGKKENSITMSAQCLCDSLSFVGKYCEYIGETKLSVILHGGEPTLIAVDKYEGAFRKFIHDYPSITLEISMQTNGYYISNTMLDFIKRWGISVGFSIDGIEKIHNMNRKDLEGKGTYKDVMDNIIVLKNNGIDVSVLIVVTKDIVNAGFDYLSVFEELDVSVKINPVLSVGEACENKDLIISRGDYARYIIKIYEYLISTDSTLSVSPIDEFLNSVLYDIPMLSCIFHRDCIQNYLSISSDGSLYPCGRFADIKKYCLGTIYDEPQVIASNPVKIQLSKRRELVDRHCKNCNYLYKCNAGCCFEAEVNNGKYSFFCDDYKILFDYFETEGLKLLRNYLVKIRNKIIQDNC